MMRKALSPAHDLHTASAMRADRLGISPAVFKDAAVLQTEHRVYHE